MTTPLTPAELIKDIKALDRSIADWHVEGRLDWDTDKYLKAARAELLEELREGFTTGYDAIFKDWMAFKGKYRIATQVGHGPTELAAIETLLSLLHSDA